MARRLKRISDIFTIHKLKLVAAVSLSVVSVCAVPRSAPSRTPPSIQPAVSDPTSNGADAQGFNSSYDASVSALLCAAHAPPAARKAATPGRLLPVIFTTEQNGYLTPCGCSKPQLGGMPRMATFLRQLKSGVKPLELQNGDLTNAMDRQDQLKAETLIEMFNAIHSDAINLGEKDFRLGTPLLQSLQARFRGTMLCGNVQGPDGKLLFPAMTVLQRTIGGEHVNATVVGLLSAAFGAEVEAANPGLHVEQPAAALARLAPGLQRQSVRILLYHGTEAEASALAQRFPFFQLIICAHEGDHPTPPVHAGKSVLVCSGQDGKYVGEAALQVSGAPGVHAVRYSSLEPDLVDDPAQLQIKSAYLQRVDMEGLISQVIRLPTDTGDTFAGSRACAACHAAAFRVWQQSGHSHTLATLAEVKENRDPECVVCHVVGLDRQGGFASQSQTPELANVGCESCHGPAARHVQNPRVAMPHITSETCETCHTPQQSPNYNFTTFWPRIKH